MNSGDSKIYMVNNRGNPYTACPDCGQGSIRINKLPFLTCPAFHTFHQCPTCKDTRISDQKENIYYCGLLHAYHLCAVHKCAVVGPARMTSLCTCQPPSSILRQNKIQNWNSPFV